MEYSTTDIKLGCLKLAVQAIGQASQMLFADDHAQEVVKAADMFHEWLTRVKQADAPVIPATDAPEEKHSRQKLMIYRQFFHAITQMPRGVIWFNQVEYVLKAKEKAELSLERLAVHGDSDAADAKADADFWASHGNKG